MSSKLFKYAALIYCLSVSLNSAWAGDDYLTLKNTIKASGEYLLMKDILDEKATSSDILSKYGNISVETLASEGFIRPPQILIILARAGLDLSKVKMLSPASMEIFVKQDFKIMDKLKSGVLAYANTKEKDHKYYDALIDAESVKNVSFQSGDKLTINSVDGENGRYQVKASVEDIRTNQKSYFEFHATLIKGQAVLVAKKDFLPGDEITRDSIEIASGNSFQSADYIDDAELLAGGKMVAKQMIEKGSPLLKSAISSPTSIAKGTLVSLVTGDDRFQVRIMGRVKEVLDNGSSVLVENVDSKKEIVGKPISANEVRILY